MKRSKLIAIFLLIMPKPIYNLNLKKMIVLDEKFRIETDSYNFTLKFEEKVIIKDKDNNDFKIHNSDFYSVC